MPQVNINGLNFNIGAEPWPPIVQGTFAQTRTQLSADELRYLVDKQGFGRSDKSNVWAGYNEHFGTIAYGDYNGNGIGNGDDDPVRVIYNAACWNWALTGATVFDKMTMLNPSLLFDMINSMEAGMTMSAFLAPPSHAPAPDTVAPLRAFCTANSAAVQALLSMPQTTNDEKRVKVETMVRIMCAVKGLTFPANSSSTSYAICCEYDVTDDTGAPVPPNWTHWGLQINGNQSLQTVPDCGIWKSNAGSFASEWTHVDNINHKAERAVVTVPVANLTPAHLERIRGILQYDRHGNVGGPVSRRLQCSQAACSRIHGSNRSWVNLWHRCGTCNRVFCDSCGRDLPRPSGGCFGYQLTRERQCPCGGRTALLSRADV